MTREEAIKRLEWLRMVGNHVDSVTLGKEDMPHFDMAIAALREQPRWISVDERLPEDDLSPDTDRVAIKVLTVTKHGTRRFVRELTRQRWWWKGVMQPWSWSKDAIGVTHWMPLPEPPKEEV
jgi:hypothetical protein